MRTTIRIDDALYRRLKAEAGRSGRTIGELIEDAVRASLTARRARPEVTPLPTHAGRGVLPGVDLSSNASLVETMDDDALDALR